MYRLRTLYIGGLVVSQIWWAYQDLNLEPRHYECSALTD
jgi:hypothetical protein